MNRKVLIVIGKYQVDTALLTSLLYNQGIIAGNAKVEEKNEDGVCAMFENVAIKALNKNILKEYDVCNNSPSKALVTKRKKLLSKVIDVVEQEFANSQLFILNQPSSELLPFWEEVFKKLYIEIKIIHIIRNPLNTDDLCFDGAVSENVQPSWLDYTLKIEFQTRKFHRILIKHNDLISNPAKMINRIFKKFDLDLQYASSETLKKSLHTDLSNDSLEYRVYKEIVEQTNTYELNDYLDDKRKEIQIIKQQKKFQKNIHLIVFSKDRAFQLEALLRSIKQNCDIFKTIDVVYTYSNNEFKKGYDILQQNNKNANFIKEKNFKQDVINSIKKSASELLCFLVDDCIAYRKAGQTNPLCFELLGDEVCFSLRLGDNCINSPLQKTSFDFLNGFSFNWREQTKNFNYPFSTDGHIFEKDCLFDFIGKINFANANKLEIGLNSFFKTANPKMCCFNKSVIVSLPVNKVSDTSSCSSGVTFDYPTEELNGFFINDKRMDFDNMDFSKVNDCHNEIKFKIK